MQLNLAAVDQGIEVAADEHEHCGAEGEHQDGDQRDDELVREELPKEPDIALPHMLEAALEGAMEPRK